MNKAFVKEAEGADDDDDAPSLPPLPAGTRNYIAVVAASNCAAHTAELIAQSYALETMPPNVDGVIAFPHVEGCGHSVGPDTVQLQRTLRGVLERAARS